MTLDEALTAITEEHARATAKHPAPRASLHEAYAYFQEEAEECWEAIRQDAPAHARHEAVQACAMLLRLMVECS